MIKKVIEYIENASFVNALIIALIAPIIRGVLEGAIDHNKMLTNPIEYKSALFIFLHQYAFFFAVYLVLSLLIKFFFPKKNTIKVLKFIFITSIVIVVPPIVDAILGGNFKPKYIFSKEEFIYSLLNVFNPFVELSALSPGMRIELFIVVIGVLVYSWLIERNIIKSIIVLALFLTATGFIGSFPGFIGKEKFDTFSLIQTDTQRYATINLYFLAISLILLFPNYFLKILKMRIYKFLYYLPLLIFGFIGGIKVVKFTYSNAFANIFDYIGILNIVLSLFLAFLIALIINDYYDRQIDEINKKLNVFNSGILKESEFLPFVLTLLVLCLSFALSTSYAVFIVLLVILSSAILYSIEPIRLKRFWIVSTLNLSFIALMSVVLGISYFYKDNPILILNPKVTLSILIGITLGFGVKDISDVEGDKKSLVFTAYTIFGNLGKFIQAVLTSSVFIIISKILEVNFIIGIIFSVISFILAIQKKFYEALFLLLFGVFSLICFLKIYSEDKFFNEVTYNYTRTELVEIRRFDVLEDKINEIIKYEPCNIDARISQMGLLYDTKRYSEVDSLANYLFKNCYLNGYLYHIWSLALWKLNKTEVAIEKAKIAVFLSENNAYWTLSAMYYLKGNNFKSLEYQNIAIRIKASNTLALTLFN